MNRKISAVIAMVTLVMLISGCSAPSDTDQSQATTDESSTGNDHIKNVTAITEVFGDGQKVSAVAVEYDADIDMSQLDTTDFTVTDQTITAVYTNTDAEKTTDPVNGKYVILELSTEMTDDAGMNSNQGGSAQGEGGTELPAGSENETNDSSQESPGASGPQLGDEATDSSEIPVLTATVAQTGDIVTADGQTYSANDEALTSTNTINLIVDDFQQFVFTDANYDNKTLMYNLYVPENYDPSKEYPLVLFMPDAGVVSNNPIATLTQGLGAVVFASPEEQAKHECFVLAPQYTSTMVNDNSEATDDMDITIDLVKDLENQYSIDTNRIYNTGQSMGGMTSIAMDIKYPDMFAASLLVACQWNSTLVTPMADDNLWIVVSEGDNKANPGMDAITEVLEENGATVAKDTFSAEADEAEIEEHISAMRAQNCSVNYVVFENGSHSYTWKYAYSIEGIRDWLFEQEKS